MFNKRLQHDFIIPNEGLYRVYLLEESDTGGTWPVIKGEGEPVKLPTGNPNNKIYTPILPGILTWRIVIRNQAERDVIDAVFDSIEGDYRVDYYQVEGGITENLIWRGDLLLDQYNEDLRGFPGFVEIVASDLGKLQGLNYLDTDGFPHTGRESQLQIIKNCVQLLGYGLGFACSDAIFEDTMDGNPLTDDPMLQAYADNAWYYPVDSFGQIRLMSAWDVMRSVLVSKACRIRQWGGRWHVEQIIPGVEGFISDGNFLVSYLDTVRIDKYNEDLNLVWSLTGTDAVIVPNYNGLAIFDDGERQRVFGLGNNGRCMAYDYQTGAIIWNEVSTGSGSASSGFSMTVDALGNVYYAIVVATSFNAILKRDYDGNVVWLLNLGSLPINLITIDGDGTIYGGTTNGRMFKVTQDENGVNPALDLNIAFTETTSTQVRGIQIDGDFILIVTTNISFATERRIIWFDKNLLTVISYVAFGGVSDTGDVLVLDNDSIIYRTITDALTKRINRVSRSGQLINTRDGNEFDARFFTRNTRDNIFLGRIILDNELNEISDTISVPAEVINAVAHPYLFPVPPEAPQPVTITEDFSGYPVGSGIPPNFSRTLQLQQVTDSIATGGLISANKYQIVPNTGDQRTSIYTPITFKNKSQNIHLIGLFRMTGSINVNNMVAFSINTKFSNVAGQTMYAVRYRHTIGFGLVRAINGSFTSLDLDATMNLSVTDPFYIEVLKTDDNFKAWWWLESGTRPVDPQIDFTDTETLDIGGVGVYTFNSITYECHYISAGLNGASAVMP